MEILAEGPGNEPDNQLALDIEVCKQKTFLKARKKMQTNWAK